MLNVSKIRTATLGVADTVGKKKDGTFMVRRGYFYRNGMDAERFRDVVVKSLESHGFSCQVVDHGDHWAAFRGGSTVAQGSHFWVQVRSVD